MDTKSGDFAQRLLRLLSTDELYYSLFKSLVVIQPFVTFLPK